MLMIQGLIRQMALVCGFLDISFRQPITFFTRLDLDSNQCINFRRTPCKWRPDWYLLCRCCKLLVCCADHRQLCDCVCRCKSVLRVISLIKVIAVETETCDSFDSCGYDRAFTWIDGVYHERIHHYYLIVQVLVITMKIKNYFANPFVYDDF